MGLDDFSFKVYTDAVKTFAWQGAGGSHPLFLVKKLKSSEQSSIDYTLPARTFAPDTSRAGIASVSYGLLLLLPGGIVPSESFILPILI